MYIGYLSLASKYNRMLKYVYYKCLLHEINPSQNRVFKHLASKN